MRCFLKKVNKISFTYKIPNKKSPSIRNKKKLGGGNSNMFYFHTENWGRFPILTHIFQMGWFNHQLENLPNNVFGSETTTGPAGTKAASSLSSKLSWRRRPSRPTETRGDSPVSGEGFFCLDLIFSNKQTNQNNQTNQNKQTKQNKPNQTTPNQTKPNQNKPNKPNGSFQKIMVPPNHPFFNRVFHYKPSILGYSYFWKQTNKQTNKPNQTKPKQNKTKQNKTNQNKTKPYKQLTDIPSWELTVFALKK